MKRRSNDQDRAELEEQAMAELARQAGQPPSRPSMPRSGGGAAPAWGMGTTPSATPAPEPAWKRAAARERALPEPEWEADEADEADEAGELEEEWEEDGWEDDEGGDEPIGLLGVPLDYDATGIALQQLAERSNIRRPVGAISGVDPTDAERVRDRAIAQFLDRQKVRARQDAELAAAREAANPRPKAPTKRAAYPPLSPGLSAKSLVMQPVAAPPLNRLPTADQASAGTAAPVARAGGGGGKKAAAKKAVAKKAAAKKAVTKRPAGTKASATKAVTKRPAGTKASATKAGAAKAGTAKAGTAKAGTAKAGTAKAGAAKGGTAKGGTAKAGTAPVVAARSGAAKPRGTRAGTEGGSATAVAEKAVAETMAATDPGSARTAARSGGVRKAVTRRAVVEAPAPVSTEAPSLADTTASKAAPRAGTRAGRPRPSRAARSQLVAESADPAEGSEVPDTPMVAPAAAASRPARKTLGTRKAATAVRGEAAQADPTEAVDGTSEDLSGGGVVARAGARVGTRSRPGRTSAADRSRAAFDEAAREMASAGATPPTMDEADDAETSAPGPAPEAAPGRSRIGTRARRRQT